MDSQFNDYPFFLWYNKRIIKLLDNGFIGKSNLKT